MSKRKRSPSTKFDVQALLDKMPPPTPPVSTDENKRTESGAELAEIFKDLNFDYSSQQGKLKAKQTQTTPEAKPDIGRSLGFDTDEDGDEEERQGADTPIRPKPLIAEKGSLTFLGGRKTRRKKRRRKTTRKKHRRKTKKRKKRRRKRKTKRRRR